MNMSYDPSKYWERRLKLHHGLRGVGHISFSESYNRWLYRAKDRALSGILTASAVSGKDVLDVGCGTGHFVDWYTARRANVSGVDIAQQSIEALRGRSGGKFEVVDISGPGAPTLGRFDIVNAWDVLYHVVDDDAFERAAGYIATSLRPGGLLIMSDRLAASEDICPAPHVKMRCLRTYRHHFERWSVELVENRFLFGWLNRYVTLPVIDSVLGPLFYYLDSRPAPPASDNLSVGIWRRSTSS